MSTEGWPAHNHGPSEGRGLYCGEKPIGWCIRDAKDDEIDSLRTEVERLRIDPDHIEELLGIDPNDPLYRVAKVAVDWRKGAESAEAEVARLTTLLEQRTAALTRTIDAKDAAEAQIARMRAAVNLLDDGDITPTGRRMLNAALDGGRSSDAAGPHPRRTTVTENAPRRPMTVRFHRNSPKCFLIGASWSHDPSWGAPRLTHIYLGPFLMTITTAATPKEQA